MEILLISQRAVSRENLWIWYSCGPSSKNSHFNQHSGLLILYFHSLIQLAWISKGTQIKVGLSDVYIYYLLYVQEMQDDGGVLSACVNSACLSLLDACVSMKFLVAAVSCALGKDGTFYLDPDSKVMKNSIASLVFVFDSRTKSVISTHSEGPVSQEQYRQCLNSAKNAVDKVFEFYRIVIKKKFST